MVGYIGRKSLVSINHILNLFAFTYKISLLILKKPVVGRAVVRRAVIEQIYFTGVQALPIVIPIALIIGSLFIIQFSKVSSQYDLGKITIILIVRELGPIVTALLVILRSATAVTIEISYMNVLNETESIEMAGIAPMRIICLPRLVGITSAMLCLFIIFDLVAIVGGYCLIWMITYVNMGNLLVQIGKAITTSDIIVGLVKALCFGITITVVSLYYGFDIKKNITYIPMNTAKASIECFLYCLVINIFISAVFYL